ncbi:MAG TPA: hypothetical protein PKO15_18080 [Fibrobacteria bacterium]|nr:hypothetical protein [Fibrobacteria bacterium]
MKNVVPRSILSAVLLGGIVWIAGCSEEAAVAPDDTDRSASVADWPKGSHLAIASRSDVDHPGWLEVSGWARMGTGSLAVDWDVLDSADFSVGTNFRFETPDPGATDSVRFRNVPLVPDPFLPQGRYRLVVCYQIGSDSEVVDTLPFDLRYPPIFAVGMRFAPETLSTKTGYGHAYGTLYGSSKSFSATIDILNGDGTPHENTTFSTTMVSNPSAGWRIDEDFGVKPSADTPPGKYRFRIIIWNDKGDTIKPEFPFVVVKP